MNRAFYTGRSGLMAYQTGMDISAHNLVNVGTYGYKATKGEFRQLISNHMDANINRELEGDEKIEAGTGVKIQNQDLLFTQGNPQTTGYPLDFAITGEALFAVEARGGEIVYTRDGSFSMSLENGALYLVNSEGEYILDQNYERIVVPYKDDGSNTPDTDAVGPMLGLFTFPNPFGLQRLDGAIFRPNEISGEAQAAADDEYELYQGVVENSNVDVAQTMADVIVLQKAYQFSARVVTTADEVEQVINSLRG